MNTQNKDKIALVFGATGLIGGYLLNHLLDHPAYAKVITFGRSKSEIAHPKLTEEIVDLDQPELFTGRIKGDEIFCCLGTTRSKAGKEGFYKVDYTYCFNAAKMGKENGISQFLLISSVGADAGSTFYYSKVKGKIENAVKALNYPATHILQPSLLLGERKESRLGESIAQKVWRVIDKVAGNVFGKYSPIEGETVAQAMIYAAQSEVSGVQIYDSQELENMAVAVGKTVV
ncbi:MAG: hypothetical protein ACI9XO_002495 [Paraglaciecola sp.]|jgi:uncharacterized protein YbjT (DUF2867 family)